DHRGRRVAVRTGRRGVRDVGDRYAVLGVVGHRLHRAVRRVGADRRGVHIVRKRIAAGRHGQAARRARGRGAAPQADPDDRAGRGIGTAARRDRTRCRDRFAASVRAGDRGRHDLAPRHRHLPDAGAVPAGCARRRPFAGVRRGVAAQQPPRPVPIMASAAAITAARAGLQRETSMRSERSGERVVARTVRARRPKAREWLFALTLCSGAAFAQGSLQDLGKIVVTSVAKHPESLGDAPAAVYVITHDEIMRSGAQTLPEMLRLAPNVDVMQLTPSNYIVTSRGLSGNQQAQNFPNKLLVLIDGRSVYSPLYSGISWDTLYVLPENIDRIEVISGPAGALWGA